MSIRPLALLCPLALATCLSSPTMDTVTLQDTRPEPTRQAASEMDFTETFEIRFDDQLVGYLVKVLETPEGIVDERAYKPGTSLVQSPDFEFLGFVSRHGTAYRFDEHGAAQPVGFGSLKKNVAAFFQQSGDPQLTSIHHGMTGG